MKEGKQKAKEEKERHVHLNTEFQRIARRDKKAFFSNQCKDIKENNGMGKIKDRNCRALTEAEEISSLSQPIAFLYFFALFM